MISSFFGKTKPINYIVLSVFLFLFYSLLVLIGLEQNNIIDTIPLEVLTFGALLLILYVINEIVRVEKVTDFSSYAMLFFVLLLVTFSDTLTDKNAVFATLFLLLALWRLLAIKSIKNVKHKIFDASFLICVASLFYDWAIIFLVLVFLVINVYDRKTAKNWVVPFVAIATIFILMYAIQKLYGATSFFEEHYRFSIDFLNGNFFETGPNIKLLIYVLLIVVVMSVVFLKVRKKGGGKLLRLRIVFLAFILGAIISFFRTENASPVILTFFPAAVFFTNYLETIKRVRLRDLFIGLCTLLPLLLFVLELNQ